MGNRKLSRPADQRLALLRSIVSALFKNGRVKVTLTRAKEARRMAEKLITVARANDLNARRRVERALADRKIVSQVFKTFPERFEGRGGGYTRIIKIGRRLGDAAPMAILELL
ncbi:50S ribosomal protein L17 [Candidatus Saganbacteria bacterium]|uniref:Large ribosomal subunit protein bL17 n=1 Tax=Candidatus Saganbacteria bacterium TaxID=2575572 RepID=A0A9D6YVX8_UNCSA|nr:50S ribosomal protein L17 [Candidatus Saganbacteria bacterium]